MENALKLIGYTAAAALCMALTPTANAGCGQPVFGGAWAQPQTAHARTAEARSAEPRDAAGGQPITGLWLVTVSINGQGIYQAIEAFTSDGVEILNDNGAPQAGNVCLGAWARSPKNTIKVNHPAWNYDSNGNLIGTVVIKSEIEVQPGGDTYKGTVTIDVYDLNNQKVAPTTTADLSATRITAN